MMTSSVDIPMARRWCSPCLKGKYAGFHSVHGHSAQSGSVDAEQTPRSASVPHVEVSTNSRGSPWCMESCTCSDKESLLGGQPSWSRTEKVMSPDLLSFGFSDAIGGGHGARSMMLPEMSALFRALPGVPNKADIVRAIIDDNVLEKPTLVSRKKSLRHLTELYGLDTSKALFRVLWDLARADPASSPQLCLVCAYARDSQLRCSFELIRTLRNGEHFDRLAMERHFEVAFPIASAAP